MEFKNLAIAAIATAALVGGTSAVLAASVEGDASAEIQGAGAVSQTLELKFGVMAAGTDPAGSTVTVGTGGSVATTGDVTHLGDQQAALFNMSGGTPGDPVDVVLPLDGTVFLESDDNTMAVNSFDDNFGTNLNGLGGGSFNVGATLSVDANQPGGTYTGTYSVTVTGL